MWNCVHLKCISSLTCPLLSQDDLELLAASSSPARTVLPLKRTAVLGPSSQEQCQSPAQQYTEEALKELFRHVHHNMPDSAKKKKLVRQVHIRVFFSFQLLNWKHWCRDRASSVVELSKSRFVSLNIKNGVVIFMCVVCQADDLRDACSRAPSGPPCPQQETSPFTLLWWPHQGTQTILESCNEE